MRVPARVCWFGLGPVFRFCFLWRMAEMMCRVGKMASVRCGGLLPVLVGADKGVSDTTDVGVVPVVVPWW